MMGFFEDLEIGETEELGAHLFTAEDIKAFAAAYDPQPFHLDEEAGRQSHFGGLCASGWHTAAVWMGLMITHAKRFAEEAAAAGRPVPELGPSPGFRDLRWLRPVYAGDTITYTSTLVDKRTSSSRPRWGIVSHRNLGVNQKGEPVFEFVGTAFWARRAAG